MGFQPTDQYIPPTTFPLKTISTYDKTRDYPKLDTSRLSLHLRFGTISIRQLLAESLELNAVYVNELIWRDFYQMIVEVSKPVREYKAWKPAYDRIKWRNNEEEFQKWCDGQTGYPLVDAGMRQLNSLGWMHNRVRMVTASFLCKHLLIDWRWGESYFAKKLLDYDYASNNGGWQWAAGSGADASPYFRIFNPESQLKKFDKDLTYVKRWVPEFGTIQYARPMVNHEMARNRALEAYKAALRNNED
jgi:deoxyribodipyrimidine photo-lyase